MLSTVIPLLLRNRREKWFFMMDGLISYEKMLAQARAVYGDTVTIANIRIYSEEFKTKWYGRNSDVQALLDVVYVTK